MTPQFQTIALSDLREAKANPRRHLNKQALAELAESIREQGVMTPLLVRPFNGGHFEIAAGHRRFRAAKAAGLDEVPAIVREMDDTEFLEALVIENSQREDVHPIEEGLGFQALVKAGYSLDRISQRVSRSAWYVHDRLKLLDIGKEGANLFFDGKITLGHARLLARLKLDEQKIALADPTEHAPGGVFEFEEPELDFADAKAAVFKPAVKTRAVGEFASWIREHVRFDPANDAFPEILAETTAAIERANEQAERVVQITSRHQVPASAAGEQPILTYYAWKRADGGAEFDRETGKWRKSKTCEVSVLGVAVLGPLRGEAFRVCIDKFCETHFGKQQREREKRSTTGAKDEAAREAWEKAAPGILEALVEGVYSADVGTVGGLVLDYCLEPLDEAERETFESSVRLRKATAEVWLRRAAVAIACAGEPELHQKIAKVLGVDVAKILKEHR